MPLTYHERKPNSGRMQSLVVLLHGFSSDGSRMMPLADDLATRLPDTAFVAPDAPDLVPGKPTGRMWYSIPELDGSTPAEADARLLSAAEELDAFLDQILAQTGLPSLAVGLLGFSQGAGLAYQVGPRRSAQLGGIVAIAGRMKRKEALPAEASTKLPFLILTGADDKLLSRRETETATAALRQIGNPVEHVVMHGTGHDISRAGKEAIPASSKRTELTIRAGFHTGDVSFGIDRNKARKMRNGSETAEEDFVLERQTRRQNVGGGIWKAGKEYSGIAACRFHELAGQLPRHKVKCKPKKRWFEQVLIAGTALFLPTHFGARLGGVSRARGTESETDCYFGIEF